MYLDSAYIAKFYLNEADSARVRQKIADADALVSSTWSIAEVACAFHRQFREGKLDAAQYREVLRAFKEHTESGLWELAPVTERILRKLAALLTTLPATIYVRSGDAVHLTTAADLEEIEIWSNDRHLLAAAPYFGITGRTA